MKYLFYAVGTRLTANEWAAWVQAVGSIIAILVAIAIPLWIDSARAAARKREEGERVRAYALSFLPAIEDLRRRVSSASWHLERSGYDAMDEQAEKLRMPSELTARAFELHHLASIGQHVQEAMVATSTAANLIDSAGFYLRSGGFAVDIYGKENEISEPPDYQPYLNSAIAKLDTAIDTIRELFPGASVPKSYGQ